MPDDYLTDIYSTKEWFESLQWQQRWIRFMAGWWVGQFGRPDAVLDFGCGDGAWLKAFHDMGSKVVCGVELYDIANQFVPDCAQLFVHDLRKPLDLNKKAELLICLEVAEHLNKLDADTLCQNVVRHMSGDLLFSAAGPGQTGTEHINLQPPEYWVGRFERIGKIKFSAYKTGVARVAFENIVGDSYDFLPRNVMVFSVI